MKNIIIIIILLSPAGLFSKEIKIYGDLKKDLVSWVDKNSFLDTNLIHSLLYPYILFNLSEKKEDNEFFEEKIISIVKKSDHINKNNLSDIEKLILDYFLYSFKSHEISLENLDYNLKEYEKFNNAKPDNFSPELANYLVSLHMLSVLDPEKKINLNILINKYREYYLYYNNLNMKKQTLYYACHVIFIKSAFLKNKVKFDDVENEYDLIFKHLNEIYELKDFDLFFELYLALKLVHKGYPDYLDEYFNGAVKYIIEKQIYDDFSFNQKRHFFEVFLMALLANEKSRP